MLEHCKLRIWLFPVGAYRVNVLVFYGEVLLEGAAGSCVDGVFCDRDIALRITVVNLIVVRLAIIYAPRLCNI